MSSLISHAISQCLDFVFKQKFAFEMYAEETADCFNSVILWGKNLVWCIEIRLQIQNTIIRKMKLRFHALSASEHQMKKKSARTHGLLMSFV